MISFHLFKTTKGQMATDMLIVRQNMMRLIPTMNKTYIKPLNYYTAAEYRESRQIKMQLIQFAKYFYK